MNYAIHNKLKTVYSVPVLKLLTATIVVVWCSMLQLMNA